MRKLILFTLVFVSLLVYTVFSQEKNVKIFESRAEKRIALVIGNGNYKNVPLQNPLNDADSIATALSKIGFEVKLKKNLSLTEMKVSITEFCTQLNEEGTIGVIYYTGHGFQIGNLDYLIPIDFPTDKGTSENIKKATININFIFSQIKPKKSGINLLVFDIARDNPFRIFVDEQLGKLPEETFIAYSTSPGEVASDGTGSNSPFAEALLEKLPTPNITIEELFNRVRTSVREHSKINDVHYQTPVTSNFLSKPFYLVKKQQTGELATNITLTGKYYALIIGINQYQNMTRLLTAENDAKVVEKTLKEKYGFETELLLNSNASRQGIISNLAKYRRKLESDDNFLIYFAGHGIFDNEAGRAYWLPVDASQTDSANWISADDITSSIKAIGAKHVIVVSDSCYSGTIVGRAEIVNLSNPNERERFLQKMINGKSRTLLASGGNEPVSDSGGGNHSIFASAFLSGLNEMNSNVFTASELFSQFIQTKVAGNSAQTPQYSPLRNSGHENGDFVFSRKN